MTPIDIVSATLKFDESEPPDFWALASPIIWCLRQADVEIHAHDLAMSGQSMAFDTDQGRIVLMAGTADSGHSTVTISAPVTGTASREVARQLCYQLSQRIAARFAVRSILWQPTWQVLTPAHFSWAALQDMPRRFGATARRSLMPRYGSALA